MESHKIDFLLDKYFEGETSIAEESMLRDYFGSAHVASQHEQYKPLFQYLKREQQQTSENITPVLRQKSGRRREWLSVAASAVILMGVATFAYIRQNNNDLGTYNDPEIAMQETQKALMLLSGHVNTGVESVQYIEEYEQVKQTVFSN